MLPIVLRSLAVYGGTVSLVLVLARRFVFRIPARTGLLLAAAPLVFTGTALLTGGVYAPLDIAYEGEPLRSRREEAGIVRVHDPLAVDVVSQMIPFRQAVRESLQAGRLPLWNRFVLAGEPLLGVAQPAVFHPGTWIGLLLPLPQAWTFDMSLRIFLAALSAYLFFAGTTSEPAALLGAAAWAYSDFLVFFAGYPVTPSVAPFPLLLRGLRDLVEKGEGRAVGVTACALVLSAISGHPETLLFCAAGGGVYLLFELRGAGRGRRWRPAAGAILAAAIALGLSAVVLLPFLEVMPQTLAHLYRKLQYASSNRSDPLPDSLRRLALNVVPYLYGAEGRSQVVDRFAVPAGYAGALLFPLAMTGALGRGRRKWIWLAFVGVGLGLSARLSGLTDVVAALPVFDIAILDYFVFLAVFGIAALSVEGAGRLEAEEGGRTFVVAALAELAAIALLTAVRRPALATLGMTPGFLRQRVWLQAAPVLAAIAGVLWVRRRKPAGVGLTAGLLVLLVLQRGLEEADVYPTYPARAFYPDLPVLDPVPRNEPVRVTGLRWTLTPNVGAMYGLEDVRGYEAMEFEPLAETFHLWSIPQPVYFNRVDDASSPMLAFLGVRYALASSTFSMPEGWSLRAEERGSRLFENRSALPRAFAPRHVVWTDLPGLQLKIMSLIRDYASDGVVGRSRPGRPHWWFNGEASIQTTSYRGDAMTLDVDARGETLVGTSIPAWHGWKLTVDGRPAELLPFNRAFLAFLVPAGRHTAVLRYLPDGFLWGAGVSLATAAACVAGLARPARRTSSREP